MIEILKFIEIAVAVCLILIVLIQNKWTALNLNTMSWWTQYHCCFMNYIYF